MPERPRLVIPRMGAVDQNRHRPEPTEHRIPILDRPDVEQVDATGSAIRIGNRPATAFGHGRVLPANPTPAESSRPRHGDRKRGNGYPATAAPATSPPGTSTPAVSPVS